MRRAVTYFYTGTGNSFRVATWVHAQAQARGLEATLLSVEQVRPEEAPGIAPDAHLTVIFPTHAFTTPWKMIKVACRLGRGQGATALVVATRAGLKAGPFHPPGLSGTATFLVALILLLKGYRVCGALSVNMPSNWFSLHPMQSKASHAAIADRGRGIVESAVGRIFDGRRVWLTLNNLDGLIGGLALLPISVGYLLFGRFFLAKLFFANDRCDGCSVCARDCPVGAIRMWGEKPYWTYACESCMRCAGFCPKNAVEAGHSWGVLVYFIVSVPVSTYLFALFGEHLGLGSGARAWLAATIDTLYFYPALFASYALFALATRWRPINWLFARTTLTHYWSRYREADTKLRHLKPEAESASSADDQGGA